jgi:two-component system, OmpR family, sensor histidine kinase MtrB
VRRPLLLRHRDLEDDVAVPPRPAAPVRPVPTTHPLLRRARLGLRARVTLAFALGALVLSLSLSALTYLLVRNYLLDQRESSAVRQTYLNARLTRDGLRTLNPVVPRILAGLQAPADSRSVLFYDGNWFASAVGTGRDSLPKALRARVASGTPARQSFRRDGHPELAVGVPVPPLGARYFEIFSLDEAEKTLDTLALSLLAAGMLTTVAGAVVGRWASTRLLRPVADVAKAAAAIAGGRLETRLGGIEDADLATLASSFNSMVDALSDRIERDARFASDVSHELRSPLTTLATSVEVLLSRRSEMPIRARAALDLLAGDVKRFQRLVEDLLEISRFDAGVAELHLEEVRLAELVERAVRSAAGPDLPVELGDGVEGLIVEVDKRRLERVIANLIQNAAKYGDGATRVMVARGRSVAFVAVEDAGPGVPPAERQAVFERFFRGSASGRRRGSGSDGSGLGLSLVAEHVRLHGGQVWVEDGLEGRGARFVVELPVARA